MIYCLVCMTVLFAGAFIYTYAQVGKCAEKVYKNMDELPDNEYGLLLGTSKITRGGEINLYFQYRIQAAAELYHAGKVRKIIVSGDNRSEDYNEPEDMRQALLRAGVRDEDLLLDSAGFRTRDSVIRAKNVFDAERYTVISQKFHCERAIFFARAHHIEAVGYEAEEVPARFRFKRFFREPLSRLFAYADTKILSFLYRKFDSGD